MTQRVASASVNTINLDSLDPPAANKSVVPAAVNFDNLDPPPQVDSGKSIQQSAKKHCDSCDEALALSSAKEQAKLAENLKNLQVQKKETVPIRSTPHQISNQVKNIEAPAKALTENKGIQGDTKIKNTTPINLQNPQSLKVAPEIQISTTFTQNQNNITPYTQSKSPFIATQNPLPSNQSQGNHLGNLPKTIADKTHQPQKMTDRAAPTKEVFDPAQSDIKTSSNEPVYQFTSFGQIRQIRAQSQGTLFFSANNTPGAQTQIQMPTAQIGQHVPGASKPNLSVLSMAQQTTHFVGTPISPTSTMPLTASIPLKGVAIPQMQMNPNGDSGITTRNSVMASKGTQVQIPGDSETIPVDKNQKSVLSQNLKAEPSILQKITKTFLGPLQNITGLLQTLMSQIFGTPSKLVTSILAKFGELLSSLIMKLKKSKKVKKKNESADADSFEEEKSQPGLATL